MISNDNKTENGIYELYLDIAEGKLPECAVFKTKLQQTFEKKGQNGLITFLNDVLQNEAPRPKGRGIIK